jgi:hypothetical protein
MKKTALFLVPFLLSFSCSPVTTLDDIEKKRCSRDYLGILYDHGLEEVFTAIKFVWENSEVFPIALRRARSNTEFVLAERAIRMKLRGDRSVDIAIYFEPRGSCETYVLFIEGDYPVDYWRSEAIQYIVKESKFYLQNGEQAYRKYTREEQEALQRRPRSR